MAQAIHYEPSHTRLVEALPPIPCCPHPLILMKNGKWPALSEIAVHAMRCCAQPGARVRERRRRAQGWQCWDEAPHNGNGDVRQPSAKMGAYPTDDFLRLSTRRLKGRLAWPKKKATEICDGPDGWILRRGGAWVGQHRVPFLQQLHLFCVRIRSSPRSDAKRRKKLS